MKLNFERNRSEKELSERNVDEKKANLAHPYTTKPDRLKSTCFVICEDAVWNKQLWFENEDVNYIATYWFIALNSYNVNKNPCHWYYSTILDSTFREFIIYIWLKWTYKLYTACQQLNWKS